MPIQFDISTDAKKVLKKLKRVRKVGVNKAWRQTMDDGATLVAKGLLRQWDREFDVRRRSFMKTRGQGVLRVSKAYVNFDTGVLKRAANVHNIFADELLLDQIRGGERVPTKGKRKLFVPIGGRYRRNKNRVTYIRGDKSNPSSAVYAVSKSGPDRAIAILTPKAIIPKRFGASSVYRRVHRRLPKIAEIHLRRELKRALARGY